VNTGSEAQAIFEARPYRPQASEASIGFSSLVSCENNRNNPHTRPANRGKYCARFSLRGVDLRAHGGERATRFIRVNCNCWDCSYCGPRKARLYKHYIRCIAEDMQLNRFVTLTLDPKKFAASADCECSREENAEWIAASQGACSCKRATVKYLRETFAKFRVYAKRKFGESISYICVLEYHRNGNPHLHLLVDRYIEQRWLSKTWDRIGGGHRVDIRRVSVNSVSRYLSKYLTKELLLSAPKRTRRVTTARAIKLIPRAAGPKHFAWEFRKKNIWNAYGDEVEIYGQHDIFAQALNVAYDDEGFLSGFDVTESPGEIAVN
jgi:hypothetical protein